MKILLIGATGPLGQQVMKQGIAQGLEITAFVREEGALQERSPGLTIALGDILKPETIDAAMSGINAVICVLGGKVTLHQVTMLSEGTKNILSSMKKHQVTRIIAVTGIGAGDSRGHGGFLYDKIIEPTILKTTYEDKDRQEEVLRASDAAWVCVRPGVLTNGEATGQYRVLLNLDGVTVGKISRADVAAFLLQQLHSDEYLHKFPNLTE